ncbi:MAG: SMP-30/gluconolactonase/LRE family protein [Bacteroidota bacterium]
MKIVKLVLIAFNLIIVQNAIAQEVHTLLSDSEREFEAIHWAPNGEIFTTDYYNGRLYQIHLDGTVETLIDGFSAIAGGGFDDTGNFYFSAINDGKVYRLNSDNTYDLIGSGFNQPAGILFDPEDEGIAYVCQYGNNSVAALNLLDGTHTIIAQNQGINGPDGLVFDQNGEFIVANYNNGQLNRIEENGSVSFFTELPDSGFMGYIARGNNEYFVPSISGRKIYRIDVNGNVFHIAGSGSNGSEDGDALSASFEVPNGISINSGMDSILIADNHNIRILTNFLVSDIRENELPIEAFDIRFNHTENQIFLSFESSSNGTWNYQISSLEGKSLEINGAFQVINGRNEVKIDCPDMAHGLYFINIFDENGADLSKKFYK